MEDRIMEGGRLIGQGTYGCVFNPPLLCKRKQMSKGKVGKITIQEDLEKEINASKILSKIKEANNYFILTDSFCSPKILDNQIDPDIYKCKFLNRVYETNLKQLSMPYGGEDLYRYSLQNKELPFFTLLRHLLEAGSLMLLHGFIHYDIHSANILVFGQSFSIEQISIKTIYDRWKVLTPNYSAEPPEVTMLTAIDEDNGYSVEEALYQVLPQKRILHLIEKLLDIPMIQQIKNLEYFFNTSSAVQNMDLEKIWKLYYPGFDSWAIGCLLLEYLSKLIFSYEFIESSEWKLKKKIVITILQKMLHTNPRERIDCVEALSMLDPMNDIYQDYGIDWVDKRRAQRRKE